MVNNGLVTKCSSCEGSGEHVHKRKKTGEEIRNKCSQCAGTGVDVPPCYSCPTFGMCENKSPVPASFVEMVRQKTDEKGKERMFTKTKHFISPNRVNEAKGYIEFFRNGNGEWNLAVVDHNRFHVGHCRRFSNYLSKGTSMKTMASVIRRIGHEGLAKIVGRAFNGT